MRRALTSLAVALLVSGCATTGAGGGPQTAVERAMARCAGTMFAGALIGAVLGNNIGSGNARTGAATGVAVGGLACAIMMAMANEEDRARIASLQRAALESDTPVEETYVGKDGRARRIRISSTPVEAPALLASAGSTGTAPTAAGRVCRSNHVEMAVADVGAAQAREVFCRNPETLAWEPTAIG